MPTRSPGSIPCMSGSLQSITSDSGLYIVYALVFLMFGGIEALIIRIQLMHSHNDFVSPQVFNRMFTMHGTTMIFFVAMPILFGFANYLVPLMIGAGDMAFPRLNAFSFWLSAFGGLLLYFSFLGGNGLYGAGNAPDVGWWAYAPLTARAFSPGHSSDYWTLALLVSEHTRSGTTTCPRTGPHARVRQGTTPAKESRGLVRRTQEPDRIASLAIAQIEVRAGAVPLGGRCAEYQATGAVPQPPHKTGSPGHHVVQRRKEKLGCSISTAQQDLAVYRTFSTPTPVYNS